MEKIFTTSTNSHKRRLVVDSKTEPLRTSPAASTIAFIRQFARSYYGNSPINMSVMSLN